MAGELQTNYTTGNTLYAQVRDRNGQIWNTATPGFEAYSTANISHYNIAATEQGTASGYYVATMPAAVAGIYAVLFKVRAGGSPAETDNTVAGPAQIQWDGTHLLNLNNAPTAGDFTATMKTSVQTAADAAITANATVIEMNADLDELIATIGAAGAGLTGIENIVWEAATSAHLNLNTMGYMVGQEIATIYNDVVSLYGYLISKNGQANDSSATTTTFTTNLTDPDGFWRDQVLTFTSGALAGISRVITTYVHASGRITFDEALPSAPANPVTFTIGSVHMHSISTIPTAIWQDVTAGDFSVNGSPGKIIFTQLGGAFTTQSSSVYTVASLANAPTGGSAPTVAQIATGIFQDLTSSGDFGTAGSFGALVKANLNAAVGSIPTTPLLAANVPANFAALGITPAGKISEVVLADTLTTYTGDTPQSADVAARLTAARAGYLDNLNVGGAVASHADAVSLAAGIAAIPTSNPTTAQIATAVLTTQMTESYAALGAAPTLAQGIHMIISEAFNRSVPGTQTSTITETAKKLDGVTAAMTFTVSLDTNNNPIAQVRAS
jgi:hypothetical protein